jgi:dolichyl-phosphate beta-glucosyltransferase
VTHPRPELSLVLPCHNEDQLLPSTLDAVQVWLEASGRTYEVLVSDDSSTDRTTAIVRERMAHWPLLRLVSADPHRGKGAALTRGFRAATGVYAAFIDADLEIPIENLGPLLEALDAGADVAIGSKRMGEDAKRRPLVRRMITGGYAAWVRACLGSRVRDHQAGLKALRLDRCRPLLERVRSAGWSWDTEFLVYVQQERLSIAERAISTRVIDRASRVDVLRDSIRMALDVLALRRRGIRVR